MPAPSAASLTRLRSLVAIEHPDTRPTRTIEEVFTGAPLAEIPIGTADDVAAAVAKARAAQTDWTRTSVRDRARIIERYRTLVRSNRGFLMDVAQAETGKARSAAQEEILDIMLNARFYAREAPKLLEPERVQGMLPALTKTVVNYQAKGVVGIISPWNYPMAMSISDALPALLAGNAVVVKPDSQTPYCTLANAELLYQAGLPRELFAVVPGPGSVVGTAIAQSCDYLMFTGSTGTGRLLAEQAGHRLIGFSAELGGKNPMIIAEGANLDKVAKAATRACFANSGQVCISIERIYVEASVADEFTAKFAEHVRNMKLGSTYDFTSDMGSLASEDQVKTVSGHVDDARAKGVTVVTGGNARPDLGPLFYEPTVLTGVTDDMECARNETFGPLVSIYPVADVDEAIARANDTEYGLNASVWARTAGEGEAIAVQLRTGTVNVDEGYAPAFGSTAAPMGGMGASGIGRRHGREGLLKYCESQTVATQRVFNLDPPFGLSTELWQKALTPLISLVQQLPTRR
ncbi:succinic semialdehyde dehydrogenase [Antrihabitans cavernicola]|uniref:succinate-semialdehyde dehydrogenase (NADP(+)) n=1 Tax=Antrihabitans cavernicola TaxID=2495913 RepID=A0A5A7S2T7_9NOCA|nr:succinic semialdehyde dehydrogenase [Spelaeibacter cavernicola]KAA0017683.1 succinate-semialdehyde dehydrogenase (NADP(+)) [Spelaeibacter cavernicola]